MSYAFRLMLVGTFLASASGAQAPERERWDVTQARGQTREIDFTTSEGTWMSVDISPDGQWIVFDLLAHVYRVPIAGGQAESLTQNSGVALNFHPRYSPDGKEIAFISDRRGQNNLWIMNADGSNPRSVITDNNLRFAEPTWTPDGQFVVVRRQNVGGPGGGGGGAGNGLWMYNRAGGDGVELVGSAFNGASWPSVSRDGKYLYFHANTGTSRDVVKGSINLRRLELKTGQVIPVTAGEANQQIRLSSGGAYAPEVSPDGRWLAFARRIPNGRISYRGHEFGPRTALWLRDLETGAERVLMDPVEVDLAEGGGSRDLPGYAWARDGRSIVISQGGMLRRLNVDTREVATIPFTARVKRTISEMAYKQVAITDGPFESKFLRWTSASPDGKRLTFQSVGRVWVMDRTGNQAPRRLTPAASDPFEFSPTWSPDGQWIAFTTWDDTARGHVWRVKSTGGTPQRLTRDAAEYVHLVWSPDGKELVAVRGSGATARGQGMMFNPWYDLVRLVVDCPALNGTRRVDDQCGTPRFVTKVTRPSEADVYSVARRSIVQPSFGPEGRIFFTEEQQPEPGRGRAVTALASVKPDGSDKMVHITFPFADEAVPSPDGKWVAFQEGDNIYLTTLPASGTGTTPVQIDRKRGKFPVRQLSLEGGLFPRWRDAATVEFASGNRHFIYHVDAQKADTTQIRLSVPRPIPTGTIALTGARIVTLANRRVIENGTLIVKGGRITCVGTCATTGADRVVDATGKTIIPGLVDMHAHHHREHRGFRPRRDFEVGVYLAFGVTSNLDNSMWSQNIFPTAELIDAGEIIGPRTFSTGDPLYRGDAPRQNDLTSYDVAEQNVNRLASWGAVSLKQYQQPRRDQRQWVSHAARKRGINVTGEGGDLEYDLSMIMDGQTGWEHPLAYVPLYRDATKFFGLAKATYSVTFSVAGPGPWNEEYWWAESEVWKDPKLQRWLPWRTLLPHSRRVTLRPVSDYSFPFLAEAVADVIAEGGNGAIGAHGQAHGIAPHWEVWMAASAMGPMGALELASLRGARFLGVDKDLGSLETGKLADLLVLNANPLENIRNTTNIQYVMKGGVLYDAATLDELWPRQRPFGPRPWVNEDALRADVVPLDHFNKGPAAARATSSTKP